jgi:hypothetical protein
MGYVIDIAGEPNMTCTLGHGLDNTKKAGVDGMTQGAGGMVATAMRVVNAIPYVVAADPGMVSSLDLPPTVPRTAFHLA